MGSLAHGWRLWWCLWCRPMENRACHHHVLRLIQSCFALPLFVIEKGLKRPFLGMQAVERRGLGVLWRRAVRA